MRAFEILRKEKTGSNSLGQPIYDWVPKKTLNGWIDMLTGDEVLSNDIQENSTHVFITKDLSFWITGSDRVRDVELDKPYEIAFVDNPVGIGHHLEIYVKRVAV